MGEQEELNTRVAVLETKNEAQECRLNSLEADVGKKFDRLEAKLDQVLEAACECCSGGYTSCGFNPIYSGGGDKVI